MGEMAMIKKVFSRLFFGFLFVVCTMFLQEKAVKAAGSFVVNDRLQMLY